MLLVMILGFIVMTIAYLFIDRGKNSLYLCLANIGSVIYLFAYVLIILKYGGYHKTAQLALCLTSSISNYLSYLPVSADNLSIMLILGKSLFLIGSLLLSINLYGFSSISINRDLNIAVVILVLAHFILLYPQIYKLYCNLDYFIRNQRIFFSFIRLFYLLGIIGSLVLLISCIHKISIPWVRSKFKLVLILCGIMEFLFFIIGILGPIQISYPNGFYYISSNLLYSTSIFPWFFISIGSLLCLIIGSCSFIKYSQINRRIVLPDFKIENKLKKNRDSVSMITHGIKNQLLVLNAIVNDLKENPIDQIDADTRLEDMEDICKSMLDKVNQMHNVFRNNSMSLSITNPVSVVNEAVRQVKTDIPIETVILQYSDILADKPYLVEAIVNLIRNAVESIERTGEIEDGLVRIKLYMNMYEVVFEIGDNGEGIMKKDIKHIFDPFFSKKNSRNNWGLGLSFVQCIIEKHFGKISIDSRVGEGTTIYITIPKYRRI